MATKESRPPIDDATRTELIAKAAEVFSPAAPINRRDLFAGRFEQLGRVFEAVHTRGQHSVIFGERGVGKTSLANIVLDVAASGIASKGTTAIAKVNCSQNDTFESVWRKALAEITLDVETDEQTLAFRPRPVSETFAADSLLPQTVDPNSIRKVCDAIGKTIIILDEFDRLSPDQSPLFADTIKTLSDSSTDCTLVIVGVARDIDDLISEHASVERALVQIMMPRMKMDELHEILKKAMTALGMTMELDARNLIVLLSQGLPQYTHVLGKASTMKALHENRWDITPNDVRASIAEAIENTQQSIRKAYQEATVSARKDTIFKEVLLACALANVDDLGFFASSDVRDPLSKIMKKRYEIPNFSQHLDKFCSSDRGNVLEKSGTQRRFRFRFANPLLQPFVIMRGIRDGMLADELMDLLERKRKSGGH